mmetsp:Transcript_19233/g.39576  ORF Transcript_19233/g.39576 Transcript_19233/m.39576 type:complete len:134 (-) Transcript_19233:166-567(-)
MQINLTSSAEIVRRTPACHLNASLVQLLRFDYFDRIGLVRSANIEHIQNIELCYIRVPRRSFSKMKGENIPAYRVESAMGMLRFLRLHPRYTALPMKIGKYKEARDKANGKQVDNRPVPIYRPLFPPIISSVA